MNGLRTSRVDDVASEIAKYYGILSEKIHSSFGFASVEMYVVLCPKLAVKVLEKCRVLWKQDMESDIDS